MAPFDELIVIRQRYTPYGGAERFIERMLAQWVADGLRVRILCRDWDGDAPFEVTRLPVMSLTRAQRDRAFARLACRHVHASPRALVQSHERLDCCDIYRAGDGVHREWLRQRARRRPAWRRPLDRLSAFHRLTLRAERRLFASGRLKAVVCNSQMVKREIMQHFGVTESKLVVIHNGVDTERFHPRLRDQFRREVREAAGIAVDTPVMLFVGSGYERKGLDGTLEALARADPAIQLLVIGRERRQQHYQALAGRLQIAHRVRFLGARKDVQRWYGAADALVLPTLYDPFPNVIIEAMACGLPVITSTKSGAMDIISQDDSGLVCDALDVATLTMHMNHVCDRKVAQRIGLRARRAVEGLTLENMALQYNDLYRRLLDTHA